MPQLLMDLSAHLNDTQPIEVCVITLYKLFFFVFFKLPNFPTTTSVQSVVISRVCFQMTVKKTLSNFRRTHHDNWQQHKQQFTDDQLLVLTDLLVSPCYYA